jgi:hypothetical protein
MYKYLYKQRCKQVTLIMLIPVLMILRFGFMGKSFNKNLIVF